MHWLFSWKNCYNKITSVRKSNISKEKLPAKLPAEKFGNILAFGKESKRKLLSLISTDSFIKNNL